MSNMVRACETCKNNKGDGCAITFDKSDGTGRLVSYYKCKAKNANVIIEKDNDFTPSDCGKDYVMKKKFKQKA